MLPFLEFERGAVLAKGLVGVEGGGEKGDGGGVVERSPEVGCNEEGGGARKSRRKGGGVVEVCLNDFDAFCFPLGWGLVCCFSGERANLELG